MTNLGQHDAETAVIDGKTFRSVSNSASGEVGSATQFHYYQQGDTVWGDYLGGPIRRGYLVGSRAGDRLDFRYVHINDAGETAAGHCTSVLDVLDDGRLRLHESWAWESRAGSGQGVIEEI